ncbi:MAG: DUF4352 domain-containing protein [Oscillospiraceae bacterium]|nr:DUF4352 domain-containing protein [Oscillospiraceae bacterium]
MKKLTALMLALLMMLSLSACNLSDLLGSKDLGNNTSTSTNATGDVGEIQHTYWFDFTVNDAYLTHRVDGERADDGYQFLVVDMTVKNTFGSEITMYRYDFQIQWGDGDEDYDWPTSMDAEGYFPDSYDLRAGKKRNEQLVFEVPEDCEDFALAYQEEFENGDTGDVFFVYFSVEN